MLNQQQFPGMEWQPEPTAPAPAPRRGLDQLLRNPNKPVGMRGSVTDRMALPERRARGRVVHEAWRSTQARISDDSRDEYDEEPEPHPRTGLPEWGTVLTHEDDLDRKGIGLQRTPWNTVPDWATFQGSTHSAWNKVGEVQEVPLPTLHTGQYDVSATRLHELIDNPGEARNARSVRGLPEELPRVYRDDMDDYLVDGNHRVSADILQGQMFGRARVVTSDQGYQMSSINERIAAKKSRAEWNLKDRGMEDFHEERVNDLYYGEGNW